MFPKGELLRMVKGSHGTVIFDVRYTQQGRGFYLCPDKGCVQKASKGSRLRPCMSSKGDEAAFVGRINTALSEAVTASLKQYARMGCFKEWDGLEREDLVLVPEGLPEGEKAFLQAEARGKGARVFLLPTALIARSSQCVIAHAVPGKAAFVRNVRFIERLSGKGLDI